jgi:hypothetical protein
MFQGERVDRLKLVVVALSLLLLTQCASTYHQPGVENIPPSEVAVINLDTACRDDDCLYIWEVDGKWRGIGQVKQYELKPGPHTITFQYVTRFSVGDDAIIVSFTAEPGHLYWARSNPNGYGRDRTWSPEIFDHATGTVVSKIVGTQRPY